MKIVLDKGAFEPVRGHNDDAGLDLRTPKDYFVAAGGSVVIDTGVHVEIPKGHYGKLESKSGLNVKHGVVSLGGTIDCGYTGSIVVKLYNFGEENYLFHAGDKIVQLIVVPCVIEPLEHALYLDITARGTAGFGSTGK